MRLTSKFDLTVPTWALCAIVNGDYSGLNDEEIEKVKKFVAEYGSTCSETSEEYFSHHNAIDGNLGATVQDYDFVIFWNDTQINLAKELYAGLHGKSYNETHKIVTEAFNTSDDLRKHFNSPNSIIYCIDEIQEAKTI